MAESFGVLRSELDPVQVPISMTEGVLRGFTEVFCTSYLSLFCVRATGCRYLLNAVLADEQIQKEHYRSTLCNRF